MPIYTDLPNVAVRKSSILKTSEVWQGAETLTLADPTGYQIVSRSERARKTAV